MEKRKSAVPICNIISTHPNPDGGGNTVHKKEHNVEVELQSDGQRTRNVLLHKNEG